MKQLKKVLKHDPNATPASLVTGTRCRAPAYFHDQTLINKDRVSRLKRQCLDDLALESPQDITAFDKESNWKFISDSSIRSEDGCILLQTDTMRRIMDESDTASQTDTIMGFLRDKQCPNANLTVTSTFCQILRRWVPTQFGILFGHTASHFQIYFYTWLLNLKFRTFQLFLDGFIGMVCDFAPAERKGFEDSIVNLYKVKRDDFPMEKFYSFCQS